jgi:putative methyltransferase (TIGR01177 family)
MALLFLLKQKHLSLACAESKAASFGWGWWEHKEQPVDATLLLETRKVPAQLGLSRRIVNVRATCVPGNLRTTLGSLRWNIKKPFRVVLTKQVESKEKEHELAALIWRTMRNPRVNLEHPELIIDVIITSKAAYIGTRAWENTENFESRRAHLRPELHPSSMHPAMARALVNISCAASIHDPCCGSGGILIEVGLVHKKVSGADIDSLMVARAKKNCAAFGLYPSFRVADATVLLPRVQAIIADLPYGKSTRPIALNTFTEALLLRAARSTRRVILGVPHEIIAQEGWKVRAHFTSYVHRSMTKHFYVLERG